jgi:hypothetical protein
MGIANLNTHTPVSHLFHLIQSFPHVFHSSLTMGNEASAMAGYRVLSVLPGSPGTTANLDSYFDFIVEAAGVRLDDIGRPFTGIIAEHVNRVLHLKVYNCMTNRERDVDLTPRNDWGGAGLLGITIRFDSYENALSEVVHVLKCEPNSPGKLAGLREGTDYLLGTSDHVFHDENDLADVCEMFVDQPLSVYVYNSDDERVRQVSLTPSFKWGGEGLLGCDIGSGYLHQLPSRRNASGITVSAAALAALPSKRVRSNLGQGWVTDIRPDGFMNVTLDWTLANNRHAQLVTLEQHLRFLVDQTPLPPVQNQPVVGDAMSSSSTNNHATITTATSPTDATNDALEEEIKTINNTNSSGSEKGASNTMELDLS